MDVFAGRIRPPNYYKTVSFADTGVTLVLLGWTVSREASSWPTSDDFQSGCSLLSFTSPDEIQSILKYIYYGMSVLIG